MKIGMRKVLEDLMAVLYPESCLGCRTVISSNERGLCIRCRQQLIPRTYEAQNSLEVKLRFLCGIEFAYALFPFIKGGVVQQLLHDLKYGGNERIGNYLGQLLGECLPGIAANVDLLVPVPIHFSRRMRRGYNQSYLLAKGISEITGLDVDQHSFIRKRGVISQTHKDREKRLLAKSGFAMKPGQTLAGRRVILVDDVTTTGATLESCCRVLTLAGAHVVGAVMVAEA